MAWDYGSMELARESKLNWRGGAYIGSNRYRIVSLCFCLKKLERDWNERGAAFWLRIGIMFNKARGRELKGLCPS